MTTRTNGRPDRHFVAGRVGLLIVTDSQLAGRRCITMASLC
jgi:hypothetical protein